MEALEGFDGALMKISIHCRVLSVLNAPFPVATGDYLILYHAAHPPVGRFDWDIQNRATYRALENTATGERRIVMTGH